MERFYFVGFKPWIAGLVFSFSRGCNSDIQSIIERVNDICHSDFPVYVENEIHDAVVKISSRNPHNFVICCISNYELVSLMYCELNGIHYNI